MHDHRTRLELEAPRRAARARIGARPRYGSPRTPAASGACALARRRARLAAEASPRRPRRRRSAPQSSGRSARHASHLGALGVERIGLHAERHGRLVALVVRRQPGNELGRFADGDDEHARRHRVESTGVADLAHAQRPPQSHDDVVAGRPTRLVDDEDAVGLRRGAPSSGIGRGHARHPNHTDRLAATARSSIDWIAPRTRSASRPTRISSSAEAGA